MKTSIATVSNSGTLQEKLEAIAEAGYDGIEIFEKDFIAFDDLAARFDIAPALLARMQALNLLYDHDGNGAFFQTYSRAFAGGMFFEILQREPGYAGFGAPNAPFRIAAQKRLARAKGIPRA